MLNILQKQFAYYDFFYFLIIFVFSPELLFPPCFPHCMIHHQLHPLNDLKSRHRLLVVAITGNFQYHIRRWWHF